MKVNTKKTSLLKVHQHKTKQCSKRSWKPTSIKPLNNLKQQNQAYSGPLQTSKGFQGNQSL